MSFDDVAEYIRHEGYLLAITTEGKGWRIETDLFTAPRWFPKLGMAIAPLSRALVKDLASRHAQEDP